MNRYKNLEQVGKRLATPKDVNITEQDIGEYRTITVKRGTRLDNVAFDMYEDASLWWVIAYVNGLITPFISDKMNLVIPKNPNPIIQKVM
jgi:hypothetical protein